MNQQKNVAVLCLMTTLLFNLILDKGIVFSILMAGVVFCSYILVKTFNDVYSMREYKEEGRIYEKVIKDIIKMKI